MGNLTPAQRVEASHYLHRKQLVLYADTPPQPWALGSAASRLGASSSAAAPCAALALWLSSTEDESTME